MTDRQKRFAEIYSKNGDKEKSAVLAGYTKGDSLKAANRLLENREVKDYISRLNNKILSRGECGAVLSSIAKDDESSPSEKIKAIDMLMKISNEPDSREDNEIHISVSYGEKNENKM